MKEPYVVNEQERDSVIEKVEYNRIGDTSGGEYKIVFGRWKSGVD